MIVAVPGAEPVVGEWRMRYTLDAPAGIPPHVTVLFPFVPAERVGAVEKRLAEIVAGTPAFDLVLARTARFPELLYLEPEPAKPFAALTAAVAAEWPSTSPTSGLSK